MKKDIHFPIFFFVDFKWRMDFDFYIVNIFDKMVSKMY